MSYRKVMIDKELYTPEVCSNSCTFCKFDMNDDCFHCVFFTDALNTDTINYCVEEGILFEKCPVKPL